MVALALVPKDFDPVELVGEDELTRLVTDWLCIPEELPSELLDDPSELKDDWRLVEVLRSDVALLETVLETEAVALGPPCVREELVDPGLTTGGEAEPELVEDPEEVDDDSTLPDDRPAEVELVGPLNLDVREDDPEDEAVEPIVEMEDEPLVPELVAVESGTEDVAVLSCVSLEDVTPLELVPLTLLVADDLELFREDCDDEAPIVVTD
ncbi:hypothetical protein BDZ85DRAFT_285110 [Elsinoe ampelina]|uniref:Uncharacterized protein n=1 Tax=Elsinoe ampelina TaxID=302913 RepID=A0A6A6G213_9PEZI|nr:hypothetical protein BDZ85DRAFT_285110 [Elsinoe ampelina]